MREDKNRETDQDDAGRGAEPGRDLPPPLRFDGGCATTRARGRGWGRNRFRLVGFMLVVGPHTFHR
jgi:hypothetical protein